MGYDDYSDIRLSGAQTAAPIWAEFMKKAVTLPQYADAQPFSQPAGVVDVQLDKTTNLLATPSCPEDLQCGLHRRHRAQRNLRPGHGNARVLQPGLWFRRREGPSASASRRPARRRLERRRSAAAEDPNKKKKGLFGKIAGIFKDDKPSNDPPPKPADTGGKSPQ